MKAREILNFMLTGYVSAADAGIISVNPGDNPCDFFSGLYDSVDFRVGGTYFWFFTKDSTRDMNLKKLLGFNKSDPHQKFADYEFPTEDGWYILFKIED